MFRLPPIPVWKGLLGSTTSAWVLLHIFLVAPPLLSGVGRPTFVLLPVSVVLVALAAGVSFLDLGFHRERVLYANLGIGPGSLYAAAVIWVAGLEILLFLIVVGGTKGQGP